MKTSFVGKKKIRKSFGKIKNVTTLPNLIEVQKRSFDNFLQLGRDPKERLDHGLHDVFKTVFPVNDYTDRATVEYISYDFGQPKHDVIECSQRGITFSVPLLAWFRLKVWDIDEETETKTVRDMKEQQVYLCEIPLMTKNGTFIINGVERVVVSQMHRSPGVFFDHDRGKTHMSGKYLFSCRVIPYRGSWLDFEFDAKDILHTRIDRKRKFPITTFLQCLPSKETEKYLEECSIKKIQPDSNKIQGMSGEEILNYYYKSYKLKKNSNGWLINFNFDFYKGKTLPYDLINNKNGKIILERGTKLSSRIINEVKNKKFKEIIIKEESLFGLFVSEDIINEKNGKILVEAGTEIIEEHIKYFEENSINDLSVLLIDNVEVGPYLRNTLALDKSKSREESLFEVYKILRPGEPPTLETAEALFNKLFFSNERYDLSSVGRVKINSKLKLDTDLETRMLTKNDILSIIRELLNLRDGKGEVDDIDHLGNRRVRSVGELLENQFRIGLLRMERAIKERMSSVEVDTIMPQDIIHAKTVASAIKEFFGTSQLSQFMDQTNPLAEITHKRRVSALGPGGLSRERAGFEVRDVHQTHYGRICPVETPEGPNIGLINSLASYSRINQFGFIETPYRIVKKAKVTSEVIYLSAMEEEDYVIAQANAQIDEDGKFIDELVSCRQEGEFILSNKDTIDLMDVSPQQLVSVASSMIPFLENDDANRALMGSNMMRQAVPLIKPEAPLVGTGMERIVAQDSGSTVIAHRAGFVDQVDANRIVIRVSEKKYQKNQSRVDIYNLFKYQRSNQNTCINQKPLVNVGDFIETGDVIADGPATELGELALGRNVLAAFMPWNGYNFEDSIIISERIVRDDVFTSIHVEEFEVMARDTKLGPEEITRDIPNVSEDNLRNLDETGMVYVGADVKSGDILIGKVTPKGESPMTPEEKLLRSIFGEKASDVKDTSLKVPPGVNGTIVEIRVFSRRGIEKDERSLSIERSQIERLAQDRDDEISIIEKTFANQLRDIFNEEIFSSGSDKLTKNQKLTYENLEELKKEELLKIKVKKDTVADEIEELKKEFDTFLGNINQKFEAKVDKIQSGDELPPGVLKMIKIFVAVKRKLQPGDKMAGRHGNKGVISKIAPIEDMPMLGDGTPVDILLNPLGVPSRMNIGQIFETHLGWASAAIGKQINEMLKIMHKEGKTKKLKDDLSNIFESKKDKETISDLNEDDLIELSNNLSKGLPFATPVFDGAKEKDITDMLKNNGLNHTGQEILYDGITGEKFDRPVTIGYIYMLKLHHLVDEKIHARSIGPYSLVTQQPLGGKAQFGGQRFGEMEVWALEAYGASHVLQEMLTIKSDDVAGRTRVYESIIKGDQNFESGVPESFNVMVKELKSLVLNIEMKSKEEDLKIEQQEI
ncbi:MAG: DNA-directed RNA polymerase subunit beta [Alphaproteobacteria bacterium MarineAlpha5_Bin12]|nr:DNA-directed RNA polymerase subunit beta [Pelagibacteraceae bacterium]PPR42119.1 MAG: DNA-directed RNA polymerase subunit beta [Alphaproteobacteria bacterium MarineAlpha5_Bin12]|tara:strand:- start:20696 stop:24895 length:4200 start_codon:yes stop_codon:yes gene_type:complete